VSAGCKNHPDAPHGFLRNESHSEGRYVCECEYWEPPTREAAIMSDTPRTDDVEFTIDRNGIPHLTTQVVGADFARTLERELAAVRAQLDERDETITALRRVGLLIADGSCERCGHKRSDWDEHDRATARRERMGKA
jgi:hypothetical protein